MRQLDNFDEVKEELGKKIASMWLTYKVGDVYVSKERIKIDIWTLDEEDKVYYLPFIINNKYVELERSTPDV